MSFYDRYSEMCKKINISPTGKYAAGCLECDRSYLSKLRKSGATPSGELVARAAIMLDVSADYLLGIINEPHPVHIHYSETMSDIEIIIENKRFNSLGKSAAEAMINGLAQNENFIIDDNK